MSNGIMGTIDGTSNEDKPQVRDLPSCIRLTLFLQTALRVQQKHVETLAVPCITFLFTLSSFFSLLPYPSLRVFRVEIGEVMEQIFENLFIEHFIDAPHFSFLSLVSQSRSVAGMGPGSGRRRAELPALDEEIHALRASFWAAAYSASSNMRHVKGVDGRPSGEDVYATCRRRAFGHHNSFASQRESEVKGEENPLLSKESNFKFKMLSGLLADLQKGFRQDKLVSTDLTTLGSRISSLSTLLAEQNSVSSIGSNISVDVAYNHVEVEDRIQVKEIPRLPHRYPGRSKVVHPPKSEYSVEGLASYEASDPEPDLDEAAGQEVQPETYIRKDFDIFRNNCRVNEMSKLNDEGWNENMKSETTLEIERQSDRERNGIYASGAGSSSSGAVGQDWDAQVTLDKRVEGTLRRASRNLICHLAGTCYHPPNQDQLLLQLDGFLKNSKRSRTFNKSK